MIKKELRRAIREKDWDSAKQLDGLLNSEVERTVKIRKMRSDEKTAEAQVVKTLAEAEKIRRDRQFALATFFATLSTALIAAGTFIKSLFK